MISRFRRICKVWPTTAEGYAVMGVAVIGTSLQFTFIVSNGDLPRNLLLLLPSSLPMWLVTVLIIRAVDEWRYRGLRDNWKEVKVFHAPPDPLILLGTGEVYPRGPTIVIAPNRTGVEEKGFMGERLLCLYFNDGVRRKPIQGEPVYWQGTWGELELASVPASFEPKHGSETGVRFTRTSHLTGNPDFD
ncbi:MAG: hypothetical protein F4W95_15335 [Chloroflexi bacterium]|nr:hypothetical protein [Chloroflexota bacterium]MYD49830.1 hypothetical protein [Chloroflexota bacterium]